MARKSGFTLVELVVVIIIIGILAALGMTQYAKVVEKGRTAEAKSILGALRTAQQARYMEYGSYTTLTNLPVDAPGACTTTHYYSYTCTVAGTCTANRCSAGGKTPNGPVYSITLDINGNWSGSAGYY